MWLSCVHRSHVTQLGLVYTSYLLYSCFVCFCSHTYLFCLCVCLFTCLFVMFMCMFIHQRTKQCVRTFPFISSSTGWCCLQTYPSTTLATSTGTLTCQRFAACNMEHATCDMDHATCDMEHAQNWVLLTAGFLCMCLDLHSHPPRIPASCGQQSIDERKKFQSYHRLPSHS